MNGRRRKKIAIDGRRNRIRIDNDVRQREALVSIDCSWLPLIILDIDSIVVGFHSQHMIYMKREKKGREKSDGETTNV